MSTSRPDCTYVSINGGKLIPWKEYLEELRALSHRPRVERLEEQRHRLENNYGYGAFADGLNRQRIEAIDGQIERERLLEQGRRAFIGEPVTNINSLDPLCPFGRERFDEQEDDRGPG